MLGAFLQSGTKLRRAGAKIQFLDICTPKTGGGSELNCLSLVELLLRRLAQLFSMVLGIGLGL